MVNYKPSIKEIAVSFSNGNFELAFPYLSENITWNIIGENVLIEKGEDISIAEKLGFSKCKVSPAKPT